jgi:hypothetical protein
VKLTWSSVKKLFRRNYAHSSENYSEICFIALARAKHLSFSDEESFISLTLGEGCFAVSSPCGRCPAIAGTATLAPAAAKNGGKPIPAKRGGLECTATDRRCRSTLKRNPKYDQNWLTKMSAGRLILSADEMILRQYL